MDGMGEWVQLRAADGHMLGAYVAAPTKTPLGGIVILQEIFGVNAHIRSVVDRYADAGYLAIAPALFDRVERDVELTYDGQNTQAGMGLMQNLDFATTLSDVAAAFDHVAALGVKIGVVGFCFGGLLGWQTATRAESLSIRPACCVGFYAGGIGKFANEEPVCPVMLHFGAEDTHIGQDQVEAVRAAHPEVEIFLYAGAGHAFANDARASYQPEAAAGAFSRTLDFLKKHLA